MKDQRNTDRYSEVQTFVKAYLRKQLVLLGAEDMVLEEDLNFIDAGILNSMGFIEMLAAVEDHFDVEVPLEQYQPAELSTVSGFVSSILDSGGGMHR